MDQLGKLTFKKLEETDHPALSVFCNECDKLGYENNQSFKSIKLDKMKMPYGQFFIGLDRDKIFTFAGVHHFPEINNHAWRCLFRGAQLPGYTPTWSVNIFKSWIHLSHLLYFQITLVQEIDPSAEFYISTNVDNSKAGVSSRLDKTIMPKLVRQGMFTLNQKDVVLYNTLQNVWKLNTDVYLKQRTLEFPTSI
jgi:hypothetical protein